MTDDRQRRTTEERLRYQAKLHGLILRRSSRKLTTAPDWGKYLLAPEGTIPPPSGPAYTLTLDEVEQAITGSAQADTQPQVEESISGVVDHRTASAMNRAWRVRVLRSDLTGTQKATLLWIAEAYSDLETGGSIHPGNTCLAKDLGIGRSAASEHVAALVEAGWLIITGEHRYTGGKSREYRLGWGTKSN